MFAPLAWIFRKIARRRDDEAVFPHPQVKETLPSGWERLVRWLFGAPFTEAGAPEAVFWRWAQRAFLLALYFCFLWILYESFWAWNIFD